VERLSEQLDNMSNMLKREVMGSFLDTKNLLLGKQTEVLDAERRQNSALLAKKQDEIEMYKEKLASALGECERQLTIIEQMGEFLAQKGAQKDGGMEMSRCFSYWKEELVASRYSRMIQRWPEPHFAKGLLRKYLSGWRWASRVGRREAVDSFWTDKMQTMSTSIVAEYENRLAEMQHELNSAYGALEQEKAQRNQLYEDLMGQFRRGVCAFNLEALGVLKPTDEADEVMQHMSAAMQGGIPSVQPLKQQPLQPKNLAASNSMQQQQQPRVQAHKKVMRQGLPQGRAMTQGVTVRSRTAGPMTASGVEQENYGSDIGVMPQQQRPMVQRNAMAPGAGRLRQIPPQCGQ